MANYVYKKTEVVTKKLAGYYDAKRHMVDVDGTEKDILEELADFDGGQVEFQVRVKDETDFLE